MKALNVNVTGESRYWWVVLIVGILLVLGGFAYWFWPAAGFNIAAQIFGWLLILAGIVQLCVSMGSKQPKGWGWWLASGVINMFIGFLMVRSIILADMVFPFFLALIFIFAGIGQLCTAVQKKRNTYWWINLINGILLMVIGFLLCDGGYYREMEMVSFISALGFIYWGFTVAIAGYELKPVEEE